MTLHILFLLAGLALTAGIVFWALRRERGRGRLEGEAEAMRRAIRDAQKADDIRGAVDRGDGRERLRRFDRD